MDRRRSPLDMINSGRRRRPSASLDELDRMLAQMEGRDAPASAPADRATPYTTSDFDREPAPGWSRAPVSAEQPRRESLADRVKSLQSATRDYERARQQEDSLSNVSRIAAELQAIREEFRAQSGRGAPHEFEELRRELQHVASSVQNGASRDVSADLDRLTDAVRALSERSDDRSINVLRLELEQVRRSLDTVAREDTIRSVDQRWDDFSRKFAALEDRVGDGSAAIPELQALGRQVEDIATTLSRMPDSGALRSLEDRVRVLAASVDHIAAHQGSVPPESFAIIESRLDEISRAIVANAVAAQPASFDPAPFERIEARMASLAAQIDELVEDRAGSALVDQMAHLSGRVDEMARRIELPETMVERLADQMQLIMAKLDRETPTPDLDLVFHNMESRFEHLSALLERRQEDAVEQGQVLFRELERRLEHVAQRLDSQARAVPDQDGMLRAIDARFAEMAQHLERRTADRDDSQIRALEDRLDSISLQLERSALAPGIDASVIAGLGRQLAEMSDQLSRPGHSAVDAGEMGPRFDQIERAIAGNREAILEAARKVAVDAARAVAASGAEPQVLDSLTADLRALDTLTRRSDERNTKTFEAIHDTLLKIVDRLGSLEEARPARGYVAMDDMPPLDLTERMPAVDDRVAAPHRTPSEAAVEAASHALDSEKNEPNPAPSRSMFGGLTRAFSGRRERAAEAPPKAEPDLVQEAVAPVLDEPLDPVIANRPLEPGSGAPDLGAIMKRVRDERGQPSGAPGIDAAKSDFIAAARRAAQAAAAEAEIVKSGADSTAKGGKLKLGEMFRNKRKTALLAATGVLVVLGGMQLSSAFFADTHRAPQAAKVVEPAAVEPATAGDDVADARETTAAVRVADALAEASPVSKSELVASAASVVADDEIPAPTGQHIDLFQKVEDPAPAPLSATPAAAPVEVAALPASDTTLSPADVGPVALRDAADEGDPKAMFEVASRHAEGRGTKADPALAAEWFRRAAEVGYAPAQYRMGNVYEKGLGVERNIAQAKSWYAKAAEQGNGSAMHNLAVLLAMGGDAPADNEGAVRWFREAADLGIRDSLFNLAILAAKGAGMGQNLEESYKWFSLVADSGDRDAATKRDEIAKALRPEQLEKAKAAAKLWTPRTPDESANVVDIPDEWAEGTGAQASANAVDMRQAVLNIQSILNKNGYDAGRADGLMGGKTKNAIVAFQKDNGMEPSGEVTEALVKALLERR